MLNFDEVYIIQYIKPVVTMATQYIHVDILYAFMSFVRFLEPASIWGMFLI